MNNRNIGDVTGNSFGPNVSLQSDNVRQINIEGNTLLQSCLGELKQEIQAIADADVLEDANMQYDMLLKYIDENKPTRVEKCLSALKEMVGSAASILTIASELGIIL